MRYWRGNDWPWWQHDKQKDVHNMAIAGTTHCNGGLAACRSVCCCCSAANAMQRSNYFDASSKCKWPSRIIYTSIKWRLKICLRNATRLVAAHIIDFAWTWPRQRWPFEKAVVLGSIGRLASIATANFGLPHSMVSARPNQTKPETTLKLAIFSLANGKQNASANDFCNWQLRNWQLPTAINVWASNHWAGSSAS